MRLYPANPHYVEFRGRPVLLVGSGEHYGAVLNADFDFLPYLNELQKHGLNQVRVFSGSYREIPGEFGILNNTMAPRPEAFIAPWGKTPNGKYDLAAWNPAYFTRLHDFMKQAAAHEVVVELVLFCFWYNQALWEASPMHPNNNAQGAGPNAKDAVYALENNKLLPYQEALTRKLVEELNGYDNLYFEICNEPYSRHDHSMDLGWHHRLVEVITETEAGLPNRHMIAINYQNRTQRIQQPHPDVSICNFHYALPDAVKENYHLDKVISYDETGFIGQTGDPYRREAWSFMLSGGGIFSHLDYSFTVDQPDGSAYLFGGTPGYGGTDLRQQLSFLRQTLEEVEVWKMRPYNEMFAWYAGRVPAQVLCDPGRIYLAYFAESAPGLKHQFSLPGGDYRLEWVNPVHGQTFLTQTMHHPGGYLPVDMPGYVGDLLLKLTKTE